MKSAICYVIDTDAVEIRAIVKYQDITRRV